MEVNYKDIVKEVNKSFEENNHDAFMSHCSDNITWTMVGEEPMRGKDAILRFLEPMKGSPSSKIELINTIQEGYMVASTGMMTMAGKSSSMHFCDIYRFDGDKIEEMTSYIVDKV